MEAINYLTEWTDWLYLVIPAGAAFTVAYQSFRKTMATDEETTGDCNKKIKMTIKGSIVGLTIAGTITVIKSYYGF